MKVKKFESGEIRIDLDGGFAIHIMPEIQSVGFSQNNINAGVDISIDDFKAINKIITDNNL